MNVLLNILRYKIRNMTVSSLNSNIACEAILHCIINIESLQASQQHMNKLYENVCNGYYKEMDLWFKLHNINSASKKKFRNSSKPFWNDELTKLWKTLCTTESEYLTRRYLLNKFKQKPNIFYQSFRKANTNLSEIKELTLRDSILKILENSGVP